MNNFLVVAASLLALLLVKTGVCAQVYGPSPGHDVISGFNPQRSEALTVQIWTGKILSYRVVDETLPEGFPQRTEITFQRDRDANRYTIYLSSPTRVNGKIWRCSVPTSTSVYRNSYNVCPNLPSDIALNRTEVRLEIWFTNSPIDSRDTVPATDNITAI